MRIRDFITGESPPRPYAYTHTERFAETPLQFLTHMGFMGEFVCLSRGNVTRVLPVGM